MDNFTLIKESWPAVLERIKMENDLTAVSYSTWIVPLEIHGADQEGLTLIAPSEGAINILNKRYTKAIRDAVLAETGLSLRIYYITPEQAEAGAKGNAPATEDEKFEELYEKAHLNAKYTFDSFVVGSNNKFAHAAALAVAEAPGEIYNPLYLYAGVGLGKTHLMHSIAHFILHDDPEKRVLYVTSETFTNELVESIRNGSSSAMPKFREKYRNIDVLLIDDIQFIIGKESTQEEFFHTFNALYGAKKQIIVSSDKPPKDLGILEERIKSRLEMGLIADISSPDYETRLAILRKKQEHDGIQLDEEILDYIATNIKSNIRELEGCLNRCQAKARLEKRNVDLELAEQILKDMISPDKEKVLTTDMIVRTVANYYNISVEQICSQKRDKKFLHPRMVAMYLARLLTNDALQTIANALNKSDHTTAINSIQKIEREIEVNPTTRDEVENIKKMLV